MSGHADRHTGTEPTTAQPARFRHSGAVAVAAVVAAIGAVPLATAGWYYLPAVLVPLLIAAWAWRSGTDADASGLRVRATFGQRRVAWTDVVELAADDRGRATALLSDGWVLSLPAVRATDLPRLVAAAGQPPGPTPEPDPRPEAADSADSAAGQ
jgi:hypothetical protein